MIRRIAGTERIQGLIRNIISDFNSRKAPMKWTSYQIKSEDADLYMHEFNGVLGNATVLSLKKIVAAIGNRTNRILIHKKPWFMPKNEVLKIIDNTLESLQPQKLTNLMGLKYDISGQLSESTQEFEVNGAKFIRIVRGDENRHFNENFRPYKKL